MTSRRALITLGALSSAVVAGSASLSEAAAPELRLNQIQTIGSHNSYRLEPPQKEFGLISLVGGKLAEELQYSHAPLDQQFGGQDVRQIELDLYPDPQGGKYAKPGIRLVTGQKLEYDPRMRLPGTKVQHIAAIDYHSSCLSLVDCLRLVKSWSDANDTHVPIAILLEFKDHYAVDIPVDGIPRIPLMPWTRELMLDVEKEIASVFGPDEVLKPDDVRAPGKTLEETVLTDGWPKLDDIRGKVMFLMDANDTQRAEYIEGNPNLEGRTIFTAASPGQQDAAFVQRNDANSADIPGLVRRGYMIRTRSDAGTHEARSGSTALRDQALASGAQWVSTDYPVPGLAARFHTGYFAALPGFVPARCNPVSAPVECQVVPD